MVVRSLLSMVLAAAGLSSVGQAARADTAIFAGGCFWCVESDFDAVPGVTSTVSGYIGGTTKNPTYYDHTAANHREAVKIEYDPSKVSYAQLVHTFFRTVDPTDDGGQFCDRGHSYTTAVYAVGPEQLKEAKAAKADAEATLKRPVVTEVVSAPEFWPAEDYHQDYYRTNSAKYKYYRFACGRDARVKEVWGAEAMQGVAAH